MSATVKLLHPDQVLRQFFEALIANQSDEWDRLLAMNPSIRQAEKIGLRVLKQASFEGNAELCRWAFQKFEISEEEALIAFEYAGRFGRSNLCEWFLHHTSYITNGAVNKAFLAAAQKGRFECCKWLKENTLIISEKTVAKGANAARQKGYGDLYAILIPPKLSLQQIHEAYQDHF